MLKISDALTQLVSNNPELHFSLQHKLFNLSQLARFLRPLVEARTKKQVSEPALLMALSRLQAAITRQNKPNAEDFRINDLTIQSHLSIFTLEKSREGHKKLGGIYDQAQKSGNYISISEGLSEITVIVDSSLIQMTETALAGKLIYKKNNVAAISAKFSERYAKTPGFLFSLIESLALQGINILEISSTTTEIIFYLEETSVELASATLFNRFRRISK